MAEVELYESPYVSGYRMATYYPGFVCQLFKSDEDITSRADEWEEALDELLELVKKKTADLGGNAFVGLAISLDPFAIEKDQRGLRLSAEGCPVVLEPLF